MTRAHVSFFSVSIHSSHTLTLLFSYTLTSLYLIPSYPLLFHINSFNTPTHAHTHTHSNTIPHNTLLSCTLTISPLSPLHNNTHPPLIQLHTHLLHLHTSFHLIPSSYHFPPLTPLSSSQPHSPSIYLTPYT